MNDKKIRELIERTQGGRAELYGESIILDGLKANSVDDGGVGHRVRGQARDADIKVLKQMKECLDAVIWMNPEIKATAEAIANIEKTSDSLQRRDSWEALYPALQLAKAAMVEQVGLRTLLLRTVIASASSLAPKDGTTSWADVPSEALFGGSLDLVSEPEADQAEALRDAVNGARTSIAGQGGSGVSDDEFAQILGAY